MDPDELDFDDPILDKDGKPITKEIAALKLGHWNAVSGTAAAITDYNESVKTRKKEVRDFYLIVTKYLSSSALKQVSKEYETRDPMVLLAAILKKGEPNLAANKLNATKRLQSLTWLEGEPLAGMETRVEDMQKDLVASNEPRATDSAIIVNLERAVKNVHENFKLAIMMIKGRATTSTLTEWLDQLKIVEAELVADLGENWRGKVPGGTEAPPAKTKSRHPWGNRANAATAEDDLSGGEDHRDRNRRSEDVCSSCKGPHHIRECDSPKTITCPENGCKFRRHKNSNICDNFRCALHRPKNAGQKMGGGGGRRKETASLASEAAFEKAIDKQAKTFALMMRKQEKRFKAQLEAARYGEDESSEGSDEAED
jgi:hypothetical protein